jgi:ABC-type amino acid transport substrate-binding protein
MTKLKTFLLALVAMMTLASCDMGAEDNTWQVGTSADNPPYEFMQDGEIVGFDIDLMVEIGKHLGKQVEFKNMEFHSLIAGLGTKSIDMVIAGMSVTSERQARVDFSVPYTTATVALLYRKVDKFDEVKDLNGKMVGAQLGTIWSLIAHDLAVKHKSKAISLSNNLMLVEELKNKRIDAVILEVSQAEKFQQSHANLGFFELKEYGSSFAIALPKDSELKNNIDHTIKALRKNGVIKQLEEKWGIVSAH